MDEVFKALADAHRRQLLDRLHERDGQSLRELGEGLEMTRQAVSKHLAVLETACLVTVVRHGREKLHYLNPVPINDIADRWIGRYSRERLRTLADLKHVLEKEPMSKPEFVYVTVIRTTPERLWQALTDPAFIRQYYEGTGPESDWKVGSPVKWKMSPDGESHDWGQVVLESEPYRKLAYTWHNYQPEMAEMFGWSEEKLAELRKEQISKVSFEIEPLGESVRLTVIHDDFEPGSEMLEGVSEGWPEILSSLKTLLETGEPLPAQDG
ncbi:ArsR/SmtB family transcription factor [Streptomyces sp. NPDC054796]